MTDYNDGKIHGWNGGECPVHPKSVVEGTEWKGYPWLAPASELDWQSFRGAFRVTKPYREPRVWWTALDQFGAARCIHDNVDDAKRDMRYLGLGATLVRVVEQPE